MVTIKQLQRSIELEKKKLKKAQAIDIKKIEKSNLQKELKRLQSREKLERIGKGKRLLRKAGTGLIKAGKFIGPKLKRQAKLIRDQQLRDDAIARKSRKKTRTTTRTITKLVPIKGKKKLFKKVKIKVKSPIIQKKKTQGFNFMTDLDF